MSDAGTLRLPTPDEGRRLYDLFQEAGYTQSRFADTLDFVEPPFPHLRGVARIMDLTREPTPFTTLVRWFALTTPVDAGRARDTLPPWFVELCVRIGLLVADGDRLVPTVMVLPDEHLLLASDPFQRLIDAAPDFVLGANPTAWILAHSTTRRPVRETLDLCCGSGIQALLAAPHSTAVLGTDLNPRAVALATLNARLNGTANVRFQSGDALAPAAGRAFDLVVCNPPFILAPGSDYLFRDSGLALDEFCRRLVRAVPAHLEEGGFFHMIFEWPQVRGQPWRDRLGPWFEDLGCDVLLTKTHTSPAPRYIQNHIKETPFRSYEDDAAAYERWRAFYAGHDVEAIHGAVLALRRRSGTSWVRLEEKSEDETLGRPFGTVVLRAFLAQDFLVAHAGDDRLLDATLTLAPGLELRQTFRWEDAGWQPRRMRLGQAADADRAVGLDRTLVEYLTLFDGTRTVRDALQALATKAGVTPHEAQPKCLSLTRSLIESGFLLP